MGVDIPSVQTTQGAGRIKTFGGMYAKYIETFLRVLLFTLHMPAATYMITVDVQHLYTALFGCRFMKPSFLSDHV